MNMINKKAKLTIIFDEADTVCMRQRHITISDGKTINNRYLIVSDTNHSWSLYYFLDGGFENALVVESMSLAAVLWCACLDSMSIDIDIKDNKLSDKTISFLFSINNGKDVVEMNFDMTFEETLKFTSVFGGDNYFVNKDVYLTEKSPDFADDIFNGGVLVLDDHFKIWDDLNAVYHRSMEGISDKWDVSIEIFVK